MKPDLTHEELNPADPTPSGSPIETVLAKLEAVDPGEVPADHLTDEEMTWLRMIDHRPASAGEAAALLRQLIGAA